MLRIGLDVHVLDGAPQGTASVWDGLIENLPPDARYVLYSGDAAATSRRFPGAHLEHRAFPVRTPLLRIPCAIPWLARRDGLDLVHVNYYGPPLGGTGVVVTMHDTIYLDHPEWAPGARRLLFATLARRTARRARAVIVVSEWARLRVAHHFGVRPERLHVVHNGLGDRWHHPDEDAIARAGAHLAPALPPRYLLSVGRLDPRKNLVGSVEAAGTLVREGLMDGVVHVGPDDAGGLAMLRAIETSAGAAPVLRIPRATVPELQALYRGARALLFPSFAEGFGLPVVEAMTMGTPVITSTVTALPEVAGDAALLVDPRDRRAIAAAAREVLVSPELRARLVEAGRARGARFTARRMAEETRRVYERAASQPA